MMYIFINEVPCGVLIHTRCILFKAGETSLSSPKYLSFVYDGNIHLSFGTSWGCAVCLNACDWRGYIRLHGSESFHHKWRRSLEEQ